MQNKVVDMLSRPWVSASIILKQIYLGHESFIEQYATDEDFMDAYETLTHGTQVEELDYHVHNKLLYHLGKLCTPKGERAHIIREARTSLIVGHFGVGKTVAQLQRYCYWLRMREIVCKYIKGCVMCSTSKSNNKKLLCTW